LTTTQSDKPINSPTPTANRVPKTPSGYPDRANKVKSTLAAASFTGISPAPSFLDTPPLFPDRYTDIKDGTPSRLVPLFPFFLRPDLSAIDMGQQSPTFLLFELHSPSFGFFPIDYTFPPKKSTTLTFIFVFFSNYYLTRCCRSACSPLLFLS